MPTALAATDRRLDDLDQAQRELAEAVHSVRDALERHRHILETMNHGSGTEFARLADLLRDSAAKADSLDHDMRDALGGVREALVRQEIRQRDSADFEQFARKRIVGLTEISRWALDGTAQAVAALEALRNSPDYARDLDEPEPLVSVRIATFNRTRELVDVAIPSVLGQSYRNLEVVVVNDGPNPTTREAVAALGDPRLRYFELPERTSYPDDPQSRWMVAGSGPMNAATELATGTWIAHLDDDDEFAPDHVSTLLALAAETRAELVYGALTQLNLVDGSTQTIWSDPPQHGQFSFQSAMYLRSLRFLRYDLLAWTLEEPGDWNLMRRMKLAGVRMAATREVVGHLNMVPFADKPPEDLQSGEL